MNDLDSHTQAHMFTIVQPLDKKGRGRQGHQMDVYKKEKRREEGKLGRTLCRCFHLPRSFALQMAWFKPTFGSFWFIDPVLLTIAS